MCSGEREIDWRSKGGLLFLCDNLLWILDVASIKQLLVKLILAVS